jgi:hypothetical protein
MKIKIFTTESTFVVGEPQVQNILQEANASLDVEIESLFQNQQVHSCDQGASRGHRCSNGNI